MMSLLNHAAWADWAAEPLGKAESTAQATSDTPAGEVALKRADESLVALQSVISQMKALYRRCHANKTLGGSIPNILKTSMDKVKELEDVHISALSDFIYGHQWLEIKDVKEMLIAAAPATADLNQAMMEINALVRSTTGQKAQGTD